jgi:alkyl hydroperoxide reductase subunit AhpC
VYFAKPSTSTESKASFSSCFFLSALFRFLSKIIFFALFVVSLIKFSAFFSKANKFWLKNNEIIKVNIKNLSSKLTDYSDQKVQVTGSKKISDNYVLVNSKIISEKDKQEILVDWRVFLVDNKLVIRDLVVEGLSLARTQREEFASIVANKGFSGLIQNLKDYIAKN